MSEKYPISSSIWKKNYNMKIILLLPTIGKISSKITKKILIFKAEEKLSLNFFSVNKSTEKPPLNYDFPMNSLFKPISGLFKLSKMSILWWQIS